MRIFSCLVKINFLPLKGPLMFTVFVLSSLFCRTIYLFVTS